MADPNPREIPDTVAGARAVRPAAGESLAEAHNSGGSTSRRRLCVVGIVLAAVLLAGLAAMAVLMTHSAVTANWRQHHPWYYGFQVQTAVSVFTPITAFVAAGIAFLAARISWRASLKQLALERRNFEERLRTDREHHKTEQSNVTRRDLHTRFTSISAQLANPASMTRLAGVHAISALADDWHAHDPNTRQIQVCVDVLCSYLRLPWNPDDDDAAEERSVRQAIHSILRQHLQHDATPNWSGCGLNLAGARLHDFDLAGAEIHRATFLNATFSGTTSLQGAKFTADGKDITIDFRATTFVAGDDSLGIDFTKSEFKATEGGRIDFLGATFRACGRLTRIAFDHAKFIASGEDSKISFSSAKFSAAGWNCGIRFYRAEFAADGDGDIGFSSAEFLVSGDDCWISFSGTKFVASGADISFDSAKFCASDDSSTGADQRRSRISFEEAAFSATATTPRSAGHISFHLATFSAAGNGSEINFKRAAFCADGQGSRITFNEAEWRADESSRIDFASSTSGERATFQGTGEIIFDNPHAWANVSAPWGDKDDPPSVIQIL